MNLRELLYITTIAEEKSISKAAKKLYVAQPSLSQSLQKIENALGTKLFRRTTDGLKLTYAGERYLNSAAKIISIYEDLEKEIYDINAMRKGRLVIGTTIYLGAYVLPLVLPIYKEMYPNIELSIVEFNSTELEQLITGGKIDISIMHLPIQSDAICYDTLSIDRFLLSVPPNHHLNALSYTKEGSNHPYIDLQHTAGEKFILSDPSGRIRQVTDVILKNANINPNIVLVTKSIETAKRLSAVGLGITLVPESYSKMFLSSYVPNYYYIEEKYEAYWTLVIAYHNERYLSKPAKEFIRIAKGFFVE
jgi:DNA-binding transcriptional LysR family regulator